MSKRALKWDSQQHALQNLIDLHLIILSLCFKVQTRKILQLQRLGFKEMTMHAQLGVKIEMKHHVQTFKKSTDSTKQFQFDV